MLTEKEHALVELLGGCSRLFKEISAKDVEADLAEVTDKIHQLQHIVLAQAAAREYPDRYRLLGGTWRT